VTGALHVTNGDCAETLLRQTGLARELLSWRDVLHEGPVPAVDAAELRRIRAAFLAGAGAADLGALADLTERDRTLEAHRDGHYVLWFEADLYDQLQVVQILATLAELHVAPARITLICIGEYPGIAHFAGLGELTPDQLRGLPATAATPLTAAALQAATRAWDALRAAEPVALGAVAASPSPELRFVAEAFDRLGREYPSTRDGLSLTERRILAAVAAGAETREQAFMRAAAREIRPFLGDTWCFDAIHRLVRAPVPLLEDGAGGPLRLTTTGRSVLDGEQDHVALNGIDRWIGGVHLQGRDVAWRWHEGEEAITVQGD
jgi:plasmid stabilization system protein ParE